MKILSLTSVPLDLSLGSGKTRYHWTSGLRQRGHVVDVVELCNYELWPRWKRAIKFKQAVVAFQKGKEFIKKNEYDIVEFYGDEFWLFLWWINQKKRRPVLIAHADGLELYDMEKEQLYWKTRKGLRLWIFNITHRRLSRLTFSYADKFVCGCKDDLQYVLTRKIFAKENAACIAPAVEDLFHNIPFAEKRKKNIIYVGSWIGRKGIKIIPKVISKILENHEDYIFEIFGAWHSKNEIEACFPSELLHRIKINNKLPEAELIDYLRQSDILFFPSYSEGFGLAILEAMSCGIAAVVTPTGVAAELIHGEQALIVPFDAVDLMVQSLQLLIENSALRNIISLNGFLFAKEFLWEKQVTLLDKQYQNWIAK